MLNTVKNVLKMLNISIFVEKLTPDCTVAQKILHWLKDVEYGKSCIKEGEYLKSVKKPTPHYIVAFKS